MCGIAGFVGSGDAADLARMSEALWHRGPDDARSVAEPGSGDLPCGTASRDSGPPRCRAAHVRARWHGGRRLQRRDLQPCRVETRTGGGRRSLRDRSLRHRGVAARLSAMGPGAHDPAERHVGVRHLRHGPARVVSQSRPLRSETALLHISERQLRLRVRADVAAAAPVCRQLDLEPERAEILRLRLHPRAALAVRAHLQASSRMQSRRRRTIAHPPGDSLLGLRARGARRRDAGSQQRIRVSRDTQYAAARRRATTMASRCPRRHLPERRNRFLSHQLFRAARRGAAAGDILDRLRARRLRRVRSGAPRVIAAWHAAHRKDALERGGSRRTSRKLQPASTSRPETVRSSVRTCCPRLPGGKSPWPSAAREPTSCSAATIHSVS